MSWPQWAQTAVPPVPQPPPAPASSVPVPVAPAAIPPAPTAASYSTGMTPPASYTPAQFAALPTDQQFAIQQNWQQWQTYHQQYAQWHAQYGEQYQREMQAKLGVVAPSLPFVPPVPPYNATAAPPAPTTYSVPPPPPIEQTNVLNTPNISAAASQPPPPPPPVEESVEKKVQSFEHPTPPVNPIGPVAYPNAPPPPPDDPMPPQQFKEQIVPNQMQLQQQSFQQFQQQQQQNQYYQRPLQQQDSQQQNRYQQPESHLQNRYQSLEPQQQNRFQQQDSPHRFQQQESQQNRFQQQEPQQQNRFQQQEPQKQNRFQQQESPQQNRYQQQEPQQQNRYQQQEPQQQNRYQQQEPQQQNRFQQQQPPPQWKPNNDSRNFNDRRGGFDGNDRNRNNFEDNYNNRGGRDWGRADNDNNIGRNPWQSNQQPFQGPVQIQRQNDQSTLNQQPLGQLSQSLTQTPEKQKPDESSGDMDGEKTPEEKAFDEQFQKWEEQFENWKKENANHPDRKAYREYEMKFEDCRRKLLERREVMKKRKIEKKLKEEQEIKMREEYQRSLMPKVEEQEKMREEHQRSLMPKVEDNVKEHQSSLPAKIGDNDNELQQSPAPKKEEDKVVVNLSDASKEVDVKTDAVPEQKEIKEESKQEIPSKPSKEVSSDKVEQEEVVEFLKTTKSEGGIPGLDLVAEEKPIDKGIDEDITEVIDLEADTKPERCEEKPSSSVRFPDHRPEMNQMNMSMMGSPHMIPDRQPIFSSINRIDPPQGKREIPSLLSQKFEMPVMSPPGDNRRSFDNFDSRNNVEGMNQQSPFNKHLNNDHRGGFDNFDKDVKNVEVLSQQKAFHQQSLGDDRGNSDNFENNRKNVPGINQPNSFNEQSPKDGSREDFDNFDNNRKNAQVINQQPSNESFGKFLENTASNKVGNDASSNLGVDDKGNVPTGIAELANVLADPNVLALLSAAIGNNGGGGGSGDGGAGNIMHGLTELENQAGGPKMSPWAMGQAPFQAQNQMFPNQFRGGPQQGGNFRDFGGGGGGNHNNSGNMWQDQNQSNSNSPWSNRNLGDNRGNMQPWQNRSNRQDDFRRGGNWSNRDRDMGDRKNTSWQDDVDMRSNMFDRNIFGSGGGGGDERSRSSERMADRERVNPFKDHDDRGGRANTFGNNDRERGRQRENRGDRSRSGGSRNNNNNNRDRSRSSGNSGGRQDENSNSGSHRNPFKNEQNIFDKSPAPSIPSLGGLQHGGGGNNDEFFRPAHVIDYQNKSLGGGGGGDGCGDVGGSDANENDNIVLPTKVVDYGHGGNNSEQGGNKDFFPMKTIDYGHSSANNPNFESNLEGRRNDFNAGRNRNRNRNRNNNNKKKSGLLQESNSTYPGPWFLFNVTSQQRPGLPTKRGKRRKTIRNLYENEFLITQDCGTDSFFFEQADKLYETLDNVDDISEDDNDFDAFESNNPSEIEELDDAVVVGTPSPVSEDVELVPVFPIKEITPPPESIKKPQLIVPTTENNNTITIDEILLKPGRESRPKKIVIILRGPPGSGKSYVAKLIKDKEVEFGGSTPRLLSIDDYFMTEIEKEEKCLNTGRKIIKKEMVYEYEKEMEQNYMQYLIKSFKKTVNDRLFNFVIVDCVNYSLRTFTEFYNNAKSANFTPYTIDLLCDLDTCLCRNIHNRSIKDIQHILDNWTPTPDQYIKLDVRSLIQSAAIREYKTEGAPDMGERASDITELSQEPNDYSEEVSNFLKSKWDVDASEDKLARLDGTSKPLQKNTTIEDYLQMDGWQSPPATSKKKRVRWADIEEKRAQDKMRAIGFVVGQTDWSRMMDPTAGSSALTKTKYIAKVKKRK